MFAHLGNIFGGHADRAHADELVGGQRPPGRGGRRRFAALVSARGRGGLGRGRGGGKRGNPDVLRRPAGMIRSEEHTSELQSLMRISYAVFCLKKKKQHTKHIKSNI